MASIISHAAAGAALSIAFAPGSAPGRFWPVAIATAVLPDAGFTSVLLQGSLITLRLATVGSFTPRSWASSSASC